MSEVNYVFLDKLIEPPISGKRPSGGVDSNSEGIPSLGGENIINSGGITYGELKRIPIHYFQIMPKGKLKNEDVLINKDGAQTGKVGFYKGDFNEAAINEHLFILRSTDLTKLNQEYLYYCLLLPETNRKIHRRITGSAQPGLNSSFIHSVDIPYHLLTKQQKIAEVLSTIDTAIEKADKLIKKYKQIKTGLMHDLFTRGVTPDGKLRPTKEQAPELYKESPIGWIPKDWKYSILDDFAYTHNELRKPISAEVRENIQGSYPYYGPTGILDYINEYLIDGKYILIGEDGDHFLKYDRWEMTILIEGKFNVNNHAHILSGKNGCKTDWLYVFFMHRDITLNLTRQGAGRLKLNKAALKKLDVVVPLESEQYKIIEIILRAKAAIDKLESHQNKLEKLKYGLMHDLLTGKKEVKIQTGGTVHD